MIYFSIGINNPFGKNRNSVSVFSSTKKISKNKNFEVDIQYKHNSLFSFEISLGFRGYSHAGPEISLTFFGFYMGLKIYDGRHWDYENNRWDEHDDN